MSTIKGLISVRNISSLSASITRPHRTTYTRTYPTVLVHPNGSTTIIRYDEPRQIIKVHFWLITFLLNKLITFPKFCSL